MGKKGNANFSLTFLFTAAMAAIVAVFLFGFFSGGAGLIGGSQKAYASTQDAVDDLFSKAGKLEDGGYPLTAYGYVEDGARIVSFDSEEKDSAGILRPKECGGLVNSCVCAFSTKSPPQVIKCKAFSSSRVESIQSSGGSFVVDSGSSFTARLSLKNRVLSVEKLG